MQITQRLTAKVGPLPVFAWALILLVGGYLAYRLASRGNTATAPAGPEVADTGGPSALDPDSTPVGSGDTGSPPASGQGGVAENWNGEILSQFGTLGSQIDALTSAVQMSPAFWPGSGDSGSGSVITNGTTPASASTATAKAAPAAKKPVAKAAAPAKVKYYTYAPTAKLPKGVSAAAKAPAKGPAGTSLHFAKGKGYYYA